MFGAEDDGREDNLNRSFVVNFDGNNGFFFLLRLPTCLSAFVVVVNMRSFLCFGRIRGLVREGNFGDNCCCV